MFIGNTDVGKSTLLSQLGGNFFSGFSFMEGYTKDIEEQPITLNC
jgi:ribosome biogenesis GTPase A